MPVEEKRRWPVTVVHVPSGSRFSRIAYWFATLFSMVLWRCKDQPQTNSAAESNMIGGCISHGSA